MIPVPANLRVWIATGHTDMRRGMTGAALQVQKISNEIRTPVTSTCSEASAAI